MRTSDTMSKFLESLPKTLNCSGSIMSSLSASAEELSRSPCKGAAVPTKTRQSSRQQASRVDETLMPDAPAAALSGQAAAGTAVRRLYRSGVPSLTIISMAESVVNSQGADAVSCGIYPQFALLQLKEVKSRARLVVASASVRTSTKP